MTPPRVVCRSRRLPLALVLSSGIAWAAPSAHARPPAAEPSLDPVSEAILRRADDFFRAGQLDSVLTIVEPLVARANDDSLLLVRARLARASAWAIGGRAAEAERESEAAYELARTLRRGPETRMALRWWAFTALIRSQSEQASQRYRWLDSLSTAAGDTLEGAYAHLGLGFLALGRSELDSAHDHYHRAIDGFARRGESAMELEARIGLARTLLQMGAVSDMRSQYDLVLARAQATGNRRALGMALNNLGAYEFEVGDPANAVRLWERSIALQREQGDPRRLFTPSNNLVLARMQLGDFDRARDDANALVALAHEVGDPEEEFRAHLRLATMEAAAGRAAEAYAGAVEVFDQSTISVDTRAEALLQMMLALRTRDGAASALDTLRTGVAELEDQLPRRWAATFAVREARLLLELSRVEEAALAVARARRLVAAFDPPALRIEFEIVDARVQRALGDPARAETALLRAQTIWEELRAVPRDPQWREQRGTLGQELHLELARLWLRTDLRNQRTTNRLLDANDPVVRSFTLLAQYKARTLNERMRGPVSDASTAPPSFDLPALRDRLRADDALLLDLHVDAENSLLFVVGADRLDAYVLGPGLELERRARLYRRLVSRDESTVRAATLASAATRLASDLFGPAEPWLRRARTIVLAPDGFTHGLPLEQMLVDGMGLDPVGRVRLFRVPSAQSWIEITAAPVTTGRLGILAVAGEARLRGARREIEWLRREIPGTEIAPIDPELPVAAQLRTLARSREILHVAAHGEALARRPWSSRLVLASTDTGTPRSIESSEIAARPFAPPLTVLSSCESAGGRVLRGEGVLGLGTAFLAAGSRAVVASLWPVDDAVTASLMRALYRELAAGQPVAVALARARERVREHAPSSHPAHWAAFVVLGDGDLRVEGLALRPAILDDRRRWFLPAALLAGAAVLLAGLLWWPRRRVRAEF